MQSFDWTSLMNEAAQAQGAAVLPDGDYHVECVKAESKSAKTGAPMIVCRFKVVGGPYHDQTVWNNFVVTVDNQNALNIFFRHMNALGLDQTFFSSQPTMESVAAALVGKQAMFQLGQREWQGQKRNEVKRVSPSGSPPPAPATQSGGVSPATPAPTPAPVPAPPPLPPAAETPPPAPAPVPVPQTAPVAATPEQNGEQPQAAPVPSAPPQPPF